MIKFELLSSREWSNFSTIMATTITQASLSVKEKNQISGEGGNRTRDTRLMSPLLYHLSYLAIRPSGRMLLCLDRIVN
jgi:hypothetical protein